MAIRHFLHRGLRVATAVALLVAVMTSPIRAPRSPGRSAHPNYLRRNFGMPKAHSSHRRTAPVTSRVVVVKAFQSENADELARTSCSTSCSPRPACRPLCKTQADPRRLRPRSSQPPAPLLKRRPIRVCAGARPSRTLDIWTAPRAARPAPAIRAGRLLAVPQPEPAAPGVRRADPLLIRRHALAPRPRRASSVRHHPSAPAPPSRHSTSCRLITAIDARVHASDQSNL